MGLVFNINAIPAADAERLIAGDFEVSWDTASSVCLDKAWGAIHYLLSGTSTSHADEDSAAHFLVNGTLLEEASEHVAIHTAQQVACFAALLNAHSDAQLLQRFDPAEMGRQDVYGAPWDLSSKPYVAQFLPGLRSFIHEAAAKHCGTVTTIC